MLVSLVFLLNFEFLVVDSIRLFKVDFDRFLLIDASFLLTTKLIGSNNRCFNICYNKNTILKAIDLNLNKFLVLMRILGFTIKLNLF